MEEGGSSNTVAVSTNQLKPWNAERILIFLVASAINFLISVCYSMIAPFYPVLGEEKQVPQFWFGIVFSIYQVTIFFSSGYWGQKVSKYGPVRVLLVGTLIMGCSLSVFSTLQLVPYAWLFIVVSIALRLIEGFGAGMMLTGLLTIVTQEFSDRLGQVMGWLEGIASTTGFLVGPLIGGLLHDAVGFWLPFVVFGIILIGFDVVCYFLFRNYNDIILPSSEEPTPTERTPLLADSQSALSGESFGPTRAVKVDEIGVIGMLKTPAVWVVGMCLVCASSSLGLIEVGLALHVSELNNATNNTMLTDLTKNAMFFINPVGYGILVLLLGKAVDSFKTYRLFFGIGLLLSSVGCLFLGPVPLIVDAIPSLSDPHIKLISTIASLFTVGAGFAFAVSPFVPSLMNIALNKGWPECTATSGAASGCIGIYYCLGQTVGPAVAAPLCQQFGFATAGGVFSCAIAVMFIIFVIFSTIYRRWFTIKSNRQVTHSSGAPINESTAVQT